MIIEDKAFLIDFSKVFNCRLSAMDMIYKTIQFNNDPEYDLSLINQVYLKVLNPRIFNHLIDSNYKILLEFLCTNIKIEPEVKDIFYSEIDTIMMDELWNPLINNYCPKIKIVENSEDQQFEIHSYDLLIDIIFQPLAEFHHETIDTYHQFLELKDGIEKYGGDISNHFLNPNSSSAFSNFIQLFVAQNIGMNIDGNSDIIVS